MVRYKTHIVGQPIRIIPSRNLQIGDRLVNPLWAASHGNYTDMHYLIIHWNEVENRFVGKIQNYPPIPNYLCKFQPDFLFLNGVNGGLDSGWYLFEFGKSERKKSGFGKFLEAHGL